MMLQFKFLEKFKVPVIREESYPYQLSNSRHNQWVLQRMLAIILLREKKQRIFESVRL